jgi:hypothetical protein
MFVRIPGKARDQRLAHSAPLLDATLGNMVMPGPGIEPG